MVDLGVCIEGIRRAIVYGRGILEYKAHPRKTGRDYGRISTEGFLKAMKVIAKSCPLSEHDRKSLLREYESYKKSPWESVALYALSDQDIFRIVNLALDSLKDFVGYEPEEYDKFALE